MNRWLMSFNNTQLEKFIKLTVTNLLNSQIYINVSNTSYILVSFLPITKEHFRYITHYLKLVHFLKLPHLCQSKRNVLNIVKPF